MWDLKYDTNELVNSQNGNRCTDIENTFMVTKRERGRRDKLGIWRLTETNYSK